MKPKYVGTVVTADSALTKEDLDKIFDEINKQTIPDKYGLDKYGRLIVIPPKKRKTK